MCACVAHRVWLILKRPALSGPQTGPEQATVKPSTYDQTRVDDQEKPKGDAPGKECHTQLCTNDAMSSIAELVDLKATGNCTTSDNPTDRPRLWQHQPCCCEMAAAKHRAGRLKRAPLPVPTMTLFRKSWTCLSLMGFGATAYPGCMQMLLHSE